MNKEGISVIVFVKYLFQTIALFDINNSVDYVDKVRYFLVANIFSLPDDM